MPWGVSGCAVPEMKDLQKMGCDGFGGEDVVLSLRSLLGVQNLVPLSWQLERVAGTCCLLAGGFVYHQLFVRDIFRKSWLQEVTLHIIETVKGPTDGECTHSLNSGETDPE